MRRTKAHVEAINRMDKEHITICEFCGKTKEGLSFVIGASTQPDWCMVEGTGKMACPGCYEKAMAEGQEAIHQATGL